MPFVFQHCVCDAVGGVNFHRHLLAALNEISKEQRDGKQSFTHHVDFKCAHGRAEGALKQFEKLKYSFSIASLAVTFT
jgi:hypothetical protein